MKAMKGRLLKKLSFFPTISTLKQGLVLQLHPPLYKTSIDDNHDHDHVKALEDDHEETGLDCSSDTESDDDLPFLDALSEQEQEPETDESESETEREARFDEDKCPPGGSECVILYTTSFRGIRKTHEDCNRIRLLLENLQVMFFERDVSMHMEFREELWRTVGERVIPPRVFIKGRYIGGAEEVVTLHEQGKLRELMDGVPLKLSNNEPCTGCGNKRFVVCNNCNGSCKISKDLMMTTTRCPHCNENGLAKCPICQ